MPATASAEAVSFPVKASLEVNCDNLGRIIGHRGGLRFTTGDSASIETRRYRVDTQTSLMRAFPRSTGFDDAVEAFSVDVAGAAIAQADDGTLTLNCMEATLTADGAAWLNDALGGDAFSGGTTIGTLSIK